MKRAREFKVTVRMCVERTYHIDAYTQRDAERIARETLYEKTQLDDGDVTWECDTEDSTMQHGELPIAID